MFVQHPFIMHLVNFGNDCTHFLVHHQSHVQCNECISCIVQRYTSFYYYYYYYYYYLLSFHPGTQHSAVCSFGPLCSYIHVVTQGLALCDCCRIWMVPCYALKRRLQGRVQAGVEVGVAGSGLQSEEVSGKTLVGWQPGTLFFFIDISHWSSGILVGYKVKVKVT